jgi:dimeric dUTPase (all-alpha-NTP-PPase superfamily)
MGLINLQTNLKSLKFGKDRPGGGNSGQPFIQKPIPDNPSSNIGLGTDALIRGGVLAPQRALEDVKRLSRYIFNPKSPSGLLFTLKENLLSRTSVKTEASKGLAYGNGNVNAGIYSPLSTLAQAGVAGLGGHLNQKGIDPTGLIQSLSINKYEDVVKQNNINFDSPIGIITGNRLLNLWQGKQLLQTNTEPILEYGGGPGSILGIGKTRIKFASERTGINNPQLKEFYIGGFQSFTHNRSKVFTKDSIDFNNYLGVSKKLEFSNEVTGISEDGKVKKGFDTVETGINNDALKGFYSGGFSSFTHNNSKVLTKDTINFNNYLGVSKKLEFNNEVTGISENGREKNTITIGGENPNPLKHSKILDVNENKEISKSDSINPHSEEDKKFNTYIVDINKKYKKSGSYKNVNIEQRVNLGDPGAVVKEKVLDKVNGSRIYKSTTGKGKTLNSPLNDLVAFRIGVINPNTPTGNLEYIHFRSYIDSFSDSYSSNWKSQTYMGRGEKFYKYQDFDRSISMAFTVVAQSQGEMNGMYQKLNFLASSLAPTYTPLGYMAGNLVKMTVGNYIYEQVGFISSITYDIPQDSSWNLSLTSDIGIDTTNNPDELPFMIKVTGLKFTPIHKFRPEKVKTDEDSNPNRFITTDIPFTPDYNNIK